MTRAKRVPVVAIARVGELDLVVGRMTDSPQILGLMFEASVQRDP